MRILIITNFYPPYHWGDNDSFCKDCVEFLQHQKHEVYLLIGNYGAKEHSLSTLKPNKPQRILRYVNYENASAIDRYYVDRHNFHTTRTVIRQLMPNLVFVWDMQGLSLSPVLAVQEEKVPHIFMMNSLWPDEYVRPGVGAGIKRAIKKMLPNTVGGALDLNPAIVTSVFLQDALAKGYQVNRSEVVPLPVTVPSQPIQTTASHRLSLMYSGRIDETKEFSTLLHGLHFLHQQGEADFHLNLYGSVETSFLVTLQKNIRSLQLTSFVSVHGVGISSLEQYQQNAIFVQPCITSGECLTQLLLAMAHGKAVIAADTPHTREIISHGTNGLLFTQGDPQSLMQQFKRLLHEPTLISAMGQAAHHYCKNKHQTEDVFARIHTLLLDEATKGKGRL